MKKNGFYLFILLTTLVVGMYASQAIFWYRVGSNGRTWTIREGRTNEVNYKRIRGEFPKTILTSDQDKEEDCGCAGG